MPARTKATAPGFRIYFCSVKGHNTHRIHCLRDGVGGLGTYPVKADMNGNIRCSMWVKNLNGECGAPMSLRTVRIPTVARRLSEINSCFPPLRRRKGSR